MERDFKNLLERVKLYENKGTQRQVQKSIQIVKRSSDFSCLFYVMPRVMAVMCGLGFQHARNSKCNCGTAH